MTLSMWESIPREIHDMILNLVVDQRDTNNLCKVSKSLYEKTVPHLYQSISLYAIEDGSEDLFESGLNAAGKKGFLRFTRDIKVSSPFVHKTCSLGNHTDEVKYHIAWASSQEKAVTAAAEQLEMLIEYCEPGAIRSLSWALGACVPQSLLGPGGYFPVKQQNLESIHLITDGGCEWNREGDLHLALSAFPHLKRLSWAGLSDPDLQALADALEQTSHQLEELEIDLTYHRGLSTNFEPSDGGEDTEIERDILHLPERRLRFPALKRLALGASSVAPGPVDHMRRRSAARINDVFDFGSLQSLRLNDCHGWEDLIILLTRRAEPLELRSLEIQWFLDNDPEDTDTYDSIVAFLENAPRLEELFISSTRAGDSLELWQALARHCPSLRRFAHHQRTFNSEREGALYQTECDVRDLSFTSGEVVEAGDTLRKLDLTTLGLCCIPRLLQDFAAKFASKTSLQVLHMRQSGGDLRTGYPSWARSADMEISEGCLAKLEKDFFEFAQWVFGPSGIRSLRLLAYGDFSYEGRFAHGNLLLCRQDASLDTQDFGDQDTGRGLCFREVRKGEDRELWELFEQEKHVLAACPSDTLFYRFSWDTNAWHNADDMIIGYRE